MKIAVDIDGVVSDSEYWIIKEIKEKTGMPVQFNKPRRYDFDSNLSRPELRGCYSRALIKYKDDIQPYDYFRTLKALRMIQSRYGIVDFVTARPIDEVEEVTYYWINKNFEGLKYNLISLNYLSKKQWMIDNGYNTIIEDRFKTVNEINFSDGKTFLVNREWNQGRKEESHVIRVKDILEAVEKILGVWVFPT